MAGRGSIGWPALALGATISSLAVVTACSAGPGRSQSLRADSAGIAITTSQPAQVRWVTGREPILSLGVLAEDGPTQFFRVRDVELLGQDEIAVVNRGSEQVRVFSLGGELIQEFGRSGRGPEEFIRLSMVQDFGDSLMTYDEGNDRITVRTRDGAFARSFRLEWFAGMLFPVDLSVSGSILAVTARYMTELDGSGIVVDTSLVSLYDLEGQLVDSLTRLPHNERFVWRAGDFQTTIGAPFASYASLVGTGPGFCSTFGPVPEIRCFNEFGELTSISRIGVEPRPVTRADESGWWSDAFDEAEGSYRDALLRVRNDIVFPVSFPAFTSLLRDDLDRLWARRYRVRDAVDEEWWVFEGGDLVAGVVTPPGFELMDVEGSRLAGVWRDELGVEFVRVYELEPN